MGRAAPAGGFTVGLPGAPPAYETSPSSITRSCVAVWSREAEGSAAESRGAPAVALPTPGSPGRAGTRARCPGTHLARGRAAPAAGRAAGLRWWPSPPPFLLCAARVGRVSGAGDGEEQSRLSPPLPAGWRASQRGGGTACRLISSPLTRRDARHARPKVGGHGRDPPKLSVSSLSPARGAVPGLRRVVASGASLPTVPKLFSSGRQHGSKGGGTSQIPLG